MHFADIVRCVAFCIIISNDTKTNDLERYNYVSILDDQLASLDRHVQLTRCFSAVAELFVLHLFLSSALIITRLSGLYCADVLLNILYSLTQVIVIFITTSSCQKSLVVIDSRYRGKQQILSLNMRAYCGIVTLRYLSYYTMRPHVINKRHPALSKITKKSAVSQGFCKNEFSTHVGLYNEYVYSR